MAVEEPRRRSRPTTRPGAASTTASASTAWARPRTAWPCRACCPCVGTFFVFSDYMRPAVRLASIMQTKVAFVWTHDSVGVGEDGPTHQPVEQLASLRAMPGLRVIRPADANEVAAAWRVHLDGDGPDRVAAHPPEDPGARRHRRAVGAPALPRGAYVLVDEGARPADLVLIGTGSEVAVAVAARDQLVEPRARGARRVDAVVGAVRSSSRRVPRRGAAARSARRSRSRPACASVGSATPTTS